MTVSRLTTGAKLLIVGLLSPIAITIGSYLWTDHCYIGGLIFGYGLAGTTVGLMAGGIMCLEGGFTTERYRHSLRAANHENDSLRNQLRIAMAEKEKFQQALVQSEIH